jgi:hypothetical protein
LYLVCVRHLAAAIWQLRLRITFIRHNTEMPAVGAFGLYKNPCLCTLLNCFTVSFAHIILGDV